MPNVGAANRIENWGTRKAKRRNNTTKKAQPKGPSFFEKLRAFVEKLAAQIREGKETITITIPLGFAKKLVAFFQRLFGKRKAPAASNAVEELPGLAPKNNGLMNVLYNSPENYDNAYLKALMDD
jgi:hypothetical protein